jgi:peptide-methionine (S)-S-oxide reductase
LFRTWSAIFTHDDEQARIAKESGERTQRRFRRPITTQIVPAPTFYGAEDYHQQYLEKRGEASCTIPAPANRTSKTVWREAK